MFNCKVFGRTKNTPLNVQNTAVERLVFKLEATGSFYTNMHHQHNWVLSNSPHSGWLKARTNLCLEHIDPWNKINIKPNVCRIVMKHPCQFFFHETGKNPCEDYFTGIYWHRSSGSKCFQQDLPSVQFIDLKCKLPLNI